MLKTAPPIPEQSLRLISWLCKSELVEEIQGNLIEHHHRLSKESRSLLIFRYWYEVLSYLRPSTLKSLSLIKSKGPMFIFNPKIAVRNLLRHGSSTAISLFGFIVGLLSVIFLYFYIENELNYDEFHVDKEKIYRVIRQAEMDGTPYNIGVTSGPFAPALLNDYPSTVQTATRVLPQEGLFHYGEKNLVERQMLFADPNFFEFFSFPLLSGDKKTVLEQPNSLVISRKISQKYFGSEDPIGKIVEIDNEYKFIVTGILGEWPNKSHLEFDMVFNLIFFDSQDWFHGWWNNGLMTYIKVNTPQEAASLDAQLPVFMDKYFGEDFERNGNKIGLTVEPLRDIHFSENTRFDRVEHGNKQSILILALVAISILFIACFNYINLAIAQSYKRAKEVGIRKVLGVNKVRLVFQFLGESIVIVFLSVMVAAIISELLLPSLNGYFGLEVAFNWADPWVAGFLVSLLLLIILTSGLYPAVLLSSFKALGVLKGNKISIGKTLIIRKGLVVSQFALSIFLIISTLLISSQLDYIKSKGLGYDQEAIFLVDNDNPEIRRNIEAFKKALLMNRHVTKVSSASGEPGGFHDGTSLNVSGVEQSLRVRTVFTDPDYLKVFDIPVVAGRGFDGNLSTEEESAMMISETALEDLGLTVDEVIGRRVEIHNWDMERTIVGIFKDYHFSSLKDEIEPLAIIMGSWHRRYAIKLRTSDFSQAMREIEEIYDGFAPGFPMSYEFQDDSLARQYLDEEKQAKVFTSFASISILLACLGIFGLASHSAQQRQKELGIRKILGASVVQVISLISKEFILLVCISAIIAIPVSWFFIESWLAEFAYHISLSAHWISFIVGGTVAGLIAFLTIGLRTYQAAVSSPIESIRYE